MNPQGTAPSAAGNLRRDLMLVAIAALVMRLLAWVLLARTPFFDTPVVDASQFDIWARALAAGREFQPGAFFKPPLYPYFLSFLYKLGLGIRGVYVLQGLAGMASCLLVTVIARRFLTPTKALAAGLVTALLPMLPFFEFQLLAETWTTLLTLMAVAWLLTGLERRGATLVRSAAQAGAALGLAALGRPNLLLVIAAVAIWLVVVLHREGRSFRRPLTAFLVLSALVMAPTTAHNWRASGSPVLISTNLGANLVTGNRDRADGVSAIPVGVEWDDLQLRAAQAGATDAAGASRFLMAEAVDWMTAHPGRTLNLTGRRLLALFSGWEPRNNIGAAWMAQEHGVFILSRFWPGTWLLLPFALAGLAAVAWDRRWALLALVMGAQALSVLPFFVNARFRLPLLPLLAIFAVLGAGALAAGLRRGMVPRRLPMAVFLTAVLLVNVDWLDLGGSRWHAEDAFNEALIALRAYGDHQPDPKAAERLLQRSVAYDPTFVDAHERHGSLLTGQALERLDLARDLMRQGRHAEVQRQGKLVLDGLAAAESHHRQAVDIFPRSYGSLANLGTVFMLRGELYAAMAATAEGAGDEAAGARLRQTAADNMASAQGWYERALTIHPRLPGGQRDLDRVRALQQALEPQNRTR